MADERVVILYLNYKLDTLQDTIDKLTRQLRGLSLLETHVILDPRTKQELARMLPGGEWIIK